MTAAQPPLRLVQVGAGLMGRAWLRTVQECAEAELVGLVDLNTEGARRAADEAGLSHVPVADSLTDLLDQSDPQAVLDVTVPAAHHAVSTAALLSGYPVLCEKPLADSVAAGLSMIAAAELSGRLLMVSQSRRYYRHLAAFRSQIARIGEIGLIECTFLKAPHFGGFREQMEYPLLVDMAIHQFDLARDLSGSEPVAVYCESFNPSWSWYAGDAAACVTFELGNGGRFGFTGSWCSAGLQTSWNGSWRVSGADGSASWDGDHAPVAETGDGATIVASAGDGPEEIAGSLSEFVAAVRTGAAPTGEAHRNVLSVAMVEAAIRSAEQGRRVDVAEILEEAYATAVRTEARADVRSVLQSWDSVHERVGASATRHPVTAPG